MTLEGHATSIANPTDTFSPAEYTEFRCGQWFAFPYHRVFMDLEHLLSQGFSQGGSLQLILQIFSQMLEAPLYCEVGVTHLTMITSASTCSRIEHRREFHGLQTHSTASPTCPYL